jgi:starvation-inducible DNA-binding protein
MTPRSACGCNGPSPDTAEPVDVVWHDPTQYDPVRHGPPYLPARLGSKAKAAVRRVASTKVEPKVARRLMGGAAPLSAVLVSLRAASFLHQTHHWQTKGPMYYADHLLFQRLYEDSQAFIDQVAERAVGLGHADLVNPVAQAQQVAQVIGVVGGSDGSPTQLVQASLRMESLVLAVIDEALSVLRSSETLTNGTDNLLQGAADLHETFVYLLQQRAANSYDYSR